MAVQTVERRAPMFSWGRSLYIQFVTVPVRDVDDGAGRKAITNERLPVYGKGCVDKGGVSMPPACRGRVNIPPTAP